MGGGVFQRGNLLEIGYRHNSAANNRIARAWCKEQGVKDKTDDDSSLETCVATGLQTQQEVLDGTSDVAVTPAPGGPD
jgi:hypothetical protein